MKVDLSIEINAPVNKVFNTFSDVTKISDIVEGINKIEILSEKKQGEGLKWKEYRTMFGKEATEVMWISDFQINKSYEIKAESNGVKYNTVYSFESLGEDKTKVQMIFEGKPQSLFGKIFSPIMSIFFTGMTKKALMADLENIKEYCEK